MPRRASDAASLQRPVHRGYRAQMTGDAATAGEAPHGSASGLLVSAGMPAAAGNGRRKVFAATFRTSPAFPGAVSSWPPASGWNRINPVHLYGPEATAAPRRRQAEISDNLQAPEKAEKEPRRARDWRGVIGGARRGWLTWSAASIAARAESANEKGPGSNARAFLETVWCRVRLSQRQQDRRSVGRLQALLLGVFIGLGGSQRRALAIKQGIGDGL